MTEAINTITGTVTRVETTGHTYYGNPIKWVVLEGEEVGDYDIARLRISDNASLVYEIENSEFQGEPHTFALTRAGRISHVVR